MRVLQDLVSTPMGMASLATIVFMLGMPLFIAIYVRRQMSRDKDHPRGVH